MPAARSSTGRQPHIVVVGSMNMDLVMRLPRLPRPGETLSARDLQALPGGKGANQAVAAARLGARVTMIGRVGDDSFGPTLLAGLKHEGIDTSPVRITPGCSSGVAAISVEEGGENSIIIVAGANGQLSPADVEAGEDFFGDADVLLVQLEIPPATVEAALALARRHAVRTVLDPAPAPRGLLPRACYEVDVLSPNQTEAEALSGLSVTSVPEAERAARLLRDRGARQVVLKMGAAGALCCDEVGRTVLVPTAPVQVVDTTAAGDAFTAGLAVGLCEGLPLTEAAQLGCAAGTLATTRVGAQPAMPGRAEVDAFLPRLRNSRA